MSETPLIKTAHIPEELYRYILEEAFREPPLLAQLRAETMQHPMAIMQIAPEQGAVMAMLVKLTGARRILEIGTFTGYSSLAMVLAMPEDGQLTALDVSEEFTAIARKYWQKAGCADRVDLRLKPASESLRELQAAGMQQQYDLCFIDADKEGYDDYYEQCLLLTRPGGLILLDNALAGGDVHAPNPESSYITSLRAINRKIRDDERVDMCLAPVGDGLLMCRVR